MDKKLKELIINLYLKYRDEHDYYAHVEELPFHLRNIESESTQKRRTTLAYKNLSDYLSLFDITPQEKRAILSLRRDLSEIVEEALEAYPFEDALTRDQIDERNIEAVKRLTNRLSGRMVRGNPDLTTKSREDIRNERRRQFQEMIEAANLPEQVYQDHPYFPPVDPQLHEIFNVYTSVTLSGDYTRIAKRNIRSHSTAKNDYITITISYPNYTRNGKWHRYAGKVYKRAKINKPKSTQEVVDKFNKICKELYLFPVS